MLRILYVIPEDWFFWTHRRTVAQAMRAAGFEVVVVTRVNRHREQIEKDGFRVVPFRLRRSCRNPILELLATIELVKIYRREAPTLVHHLTIKPVLYGSVAASLAGIPGVVNSVPGLGHVFVARDLRSRILRVFVSLAYWLAFRINGKRAEVVFENADNRETFVNAGLVARDQTKVIRGLGGITSSEYAAASSPPPGIPIIMMAGRLLWSKGVKELVEATQLVRRRGLSCRLVFVGEPDLDNPFAVPEVTLRRWQEQGIAEWWGRRSDMPFVLSQASIVVLPSMYGEGLPKILIEASAAERPIIATDIPGCRDVVRPGENGLLVPPGSIDVLADAIALLLQSPDVRAEMGKRGKQIAISEFSDEQIVRDTMEVYRKLIAIA
jgi:glycosyltransferase involved in cell wall biosynthesis